MWPLGDEGVEGCVIVGVHGVSVQKGKAHVPVPQGAVSSLIVPTSHAPTSRADVRTFVAQTWSVACALWLKNLRRNLPSNWIKLYTLFHRVNWRNYTLIFLIEYLDRISYQPVFQYFFAPMLHIEKSTVTLLQRGPLSTYMSTHVLERVWASEGASRFPDFVIFFRMNAKIFPDLLVLRCVHKSSFIIRDSFVCASSSYCIYRLLPLY